MSATLDAEGMIVRVDPPLNASAPRPSALAETAVWSVAWVKPQLSPGDSMFPPREVATLSVQVPERSELRVEIDIASKALPVAAVLDATVT